MCIARAEIRTSTHEGSCVIASCPLPLANPLNELLCIVTREGAARLDSASLPRMSELHTVFCVVVRRVITDNNHTAHIASSANKRADEQRELFQESRNAW
jgi:hypothetical protein